MKVSGKSKMYSPTDAGKKFIHQRLNEFKVVSSISWETYPRFRIRKQIYREPEQQ